MLPAHQQQLVSLITLSLKELVPAETILPTIALERPKIAAHGDLACNIAMQMAKPLGKNPREFAQALIEKILAQEESKHLLSSAEIAGPGFINFKITATTKQAVVLAILAQANQFGQSQAGQGQGVMVEFVSANPTGPLHVGHGRQGVLGDAVANLLTWQGWKVHREFYYNDAGVQINNLALSVQARAKGINPGDATWPESAYNGNYIADIAKAFLRKETVAASDGAPVTASGDVDDMVSIRAFAVTYLRREQDLDLLTFGVKFDQYYLESSLYTEGKVAAVVEALSKAGKTYEQEGALWLRSTDYGDDKDRVMRKSDGTYTYFVPDVAYHANKWARGFHKVINVQGSDHHGTIARVRAGLQGLNLGIPKTYPDYILHKMVTVMKNGEEVKISKRAGSYVTVRDLIEWSGGIVEDSANINDVERAAALVRGRDAVRFFLISRKADTEFVFDIDLALKQNDENPVYYVQYAHARICTILNQWDGDLSNLTNANLALLDSPQAMVLLQRLAEFPAMLAHAANDLAPHAVAFYLRDLAGDFHSFYNSDRVLVDDIELKHARLALLTATRQVIRNGLAVIGVSAPERM